jgi:hypothetical protein
MTIFKIQIEMIFLTMLVLTLERPLEDPAPTTAPKVVESKEEGMPKRVRV